MRTLVVALATIAFALLVGEGARFNVLQLFAGCVGFACILTMVFWRAEFPGVWNWVVILMVGVPLGLCVSPVLRDLAGFGRPSFFGIEFWMLRGLCFGLFIFAIFVVLKPQYQLSQDQAGVSRAVVCVLFAFCFLALVASLMSSWSSSDDLPHWINVGYLSARGAGRLPFSDAGNWYVCSHLIEDGVAVDWAARRPIHALIRVGELWVTGMSYQLSLILQAFICACGISVFSIAIWRVLSPMAGLLAAVSMVSLMQPFVGLFLSGCVGFTMASAAIGFLILGCQAGSYRWRLLGSLALGLAWLTRPGPLGLLAVPIVFEWVLKGKQRFLRGVIAGALLVSVLMLGRGAFALIAAPGAAQNANAAITIYGIAFGTGWHEGVKQFIEEDPTRESLSASEAASLQYELAWQQLLDQPGVTVSVLVENLADAFKDLFYLPSSMWFVRLPKFFAAVTFIVVLVVSVLAIPNALRNRRDFSWLLIGGWIAFFVSAPVIWGDAGTRGALILLPFILPLFFLFFATPRSGEDGPGKSLPRITFLPGVCAIACVVVLGVLGAMIFVAHSGGKRPDLPQVRVGWEPAVFLVSEPTRAPAFGAAHMTKEELIRACEGREGLDELVATIDAPALIIQPVETERASWTVVPGVEPRSGTVVIEESQDLEHFQFREAISWRWIDDDSPED